jgi:hypothetical protein
MNVLTRYSLPLWWYILFDLCKYRGLLADSIWTSSESIRHRFSASSPCRFFRLLNKAFFFLVKEVSKANYLTFWEIHAIGRQKARTDLDQSHVPHDYLANVLISTFIGTIIIWTRRVSLTLFKPKLIMSVNFNEWRLLANIVFNRNFIIIGDDWTYFFKIL